RICYCKPDISSLRADGYHPVDMHLHTTHSDGRATISDLKRYAEKEKIGIAITDHNEISGSRKALSTRSDILIIPGIELETREGPHLLLYFYTAGDMEDFFHDFTVERNRQTPGLLQNLPVQECLNLASDYDCLRIAAHPYGYYGINRGVLKCVEKEMLPGVLDHIDGIEVICGGMMYGLNEKAILYAEAHDIPYTGGSDAHILSDVGNVVSAVAGDTVEEFLDGIIRRENLVIGSSGGYMAKGATAGVIAWSFVPYTIEQAGAHYRYQKRRTRDLVSSCRTKLSSYCSIKKRRV
ncbi:PHP domain-containing protein, partial [Methanocalculus sp.]|uniref:PHP domain-containing protein n=1 Tax=Methanocalculus sp. TaxID=2004547 RepID=UPI00351CCD69